MLPLVGLAHDLPVDSSSGAGSSFAAAADVRSWCQRHPGLLTRARREAAMSHLKQGAVIIWMEPNEPQMMSAVAQ